MTEVSTIPALMAAWPLVLYAFTRQINLFDENGYFKKYKRREISSLLHLGAVVLAANQRIAFWHVYVYFVSWKI